MPIRTSSSAVKNRVWNLRIVSVVPPRLHGGSTAATREPSGRRESRIGCSSETSSPSARAMFLTATCRLRSSSWTSVDLLDEPVALDEDPARAVDHDLADVRVLDQVRDRPEERQDDVEAHSQRSLRDVIEVAGLHVEVVRLEIAVRRRLRIEAVVRQHDRLRVLELREDLRLEHVVELRGCTSSRR